MPPDSQGKMFGVYSVITTDQWIQLGVVGVTAAGVAVAVITALVTHINERKRTQPIVIANEDRERHFSQSVGAWVADAHLKNEGAGPAFNVRFGVEFHGVRWPYKLRLEDPDGGNVQRVLAPGERRPPAHSWPILISSLSVWGAAAEGGNPDPGRVYWARYENAQGKVWETRNPGDRSANLDIRRVRLVRFKEWREQRRRARADERSTEWHRQAFADLRAQMEQSQREQTDGQDDKPPRAPSA
jgi:hypothetical protein